MDTSYNCVKLAAASFKSKRASTTKQNGCAAPLVCFNLHYIYLISVMVLLC